MIRELTGWHVLGMLLAFFTVTIGVNVVFISAALRSSTGEYQKKSYLQGLAYNDVIADRQRQVARGWTAEYSAKRAGDTALIEVLIKDVNGSPIEGLSVTGALKRPVQAEMDRTLTFASLADGVYRATVDSAAAGQWRLTFDAQTPGKPDEHLAAEATL
ncbi:MAG TPA: hypothetical protein DCL54_09880, partial [Alphaproteobacteria bacterium]|nr:hypothetical protein [Alphaproteobacteria bacterium]